MMHRLLQIIIVMMLSISATGQEIGVELYSFRNQLPKDVPGTLQKIKEMGIRELEGGATYGLSLPEFKSLIDQMGFKMISIAADFDKLQKDLPAVIAEAKTYGAKYVVCFWIPHAGNDFTLADVQKAIDVFNTAGKILKENGLNFCYHPHGYEFRPYKNETLFDLLATSLNPDWANFEMDVFWIKHPGQDPVALLKKYPGRFPLMHLKDRQHGTPGNKNGNTDVESNVVLGKGDVGIADIMKIAGKSGVKHFFIEDESSRSMEQVPLSLQYLKSLK